MPPHPPNWNGADVLTDTLVALHYGITGSMGIRRSLGALWAAAHAAPAMEGASLTFRFMGQRVRAEVINGTAQFVYFS